MRIRKDKLILAIDNILADFERRQEAYDKALPQWQAERRKIWIRDQRPKFKALQRMIGEHGTGNKVITRDDLRGIFPSGHYDGEYKLSPFDEDVKPPQTLKFESGRAVSRPSSNLDLTQLKAMKQLLGAIEDDIVSDTNLSKLGVKNAASVFRAAVEIGGLVA